MTNTSIFNKNNLNTLYFALLGLTVPFLILFAQHALPIYLLLLTITALIAGWGKTQIAKPILITGGMFCFYIFISCFWSPDLTHSIIKAIKITAILSCATLLLTFGKEISRKNLLILANTAALSVFFLSVIVIIDDYANILNILLPNKNISYFIKPGSALIAICSFLIAFKGIETRNYKIIIFAILAMMVLMHSSITSTSQAALAVGFVASLFLAVFSSKVTPVFSVSLILLIFLSPALLSPEFIINFVNTSSDLGSSLLHRFAIWNFAICNIWDAPIFGHGIASSPLIEGGKELVTSNSLPPTFNVFPNWEYVELSGLAEHLPLHPHNMGIQLYLELGIVGITLVASIIWQVFKYAQNTKNNLLIVAFVILFVVGQSSFSIWQSWWLSFQILIVFMTIHLAPPTNTFK